MHFKFDENLDACWRESLERAGHVVSTANEEGLQGKPDHLLAELCQKQHLCLITADMDFAQVVEYPPDQYSGLVVLRHPRPTLAGMLSLIQQLAAAVGKESPTSRLWIVEPGRIRVHESP